MCRSHFHSLLDKSIYHYLSFITIVMCFYWTHQCIDMQLYVLYRNNISHPNPTSFNHPCMKNITHSFQSCINCLDIACILNDGEYLKKCFHIWRFSDPANVSKFSRRNHFFKTRPPFTLTTLQ